MPPFSTRLNEREVVPESRGSRRGGAFGFMGAAALVPLQPRRTDVWRSRDLRSIRHACDGAHVLPAARLRRMAKDAIQAFLLTAEVCRVLTGETFLKKA